MKSREWIEKRIKQLKEQANKEDLTLLQIHSLLTESTALEMVLED